MLWSTSELRGLVPQARDGEIGKLREVYFDDARWVVRHLVVTAGSWLSGRDVLLSPHAIERLDRDRRQLVVALTRKQIEDAPGIESDLPVSRQQEAAIFEHYGYPLYWSGLGAWGAAAYPLGGVAPPPRDASERDTGDAAAASAEGDPHLRSSAEVIDYGIEARDGGIGHVEELLFDERSWQIRYLVVDTRNWLPGRLVLVAPEHLKKIDWSTRRAHVDLTRDAIEASPAYERNQAMPDDYVSSVQRHFEGWQ